MKDYNVGVPYFRRLRKYVRGRYSAYIFGKVCPRICDIDTIYESYLVRISDRDVIHNYRGKIIGARILEYGAKNHSYVRRPWISNIDVIIS